MYRKSFFIVLMSLIMMGLLATGTKLVMAIPGISGLPSSYDPKIRVEDAVKTSKKPLLIEFYSDTCRTCRIVTPWMHELKDKYKDDYTFVMVDTSDSRNVPIAQIFGIQFIPAIFIFDFKHMTKAQVSPKTYRNTESLDLGIQDAIERARREAALKSKGA